MNEKLNKEKQKVVNLKHKALGFLSRREHTYHELLTKLQRYTDDIEEIKNLLLELQKKGWLSEERYISSYIDSKVNKYGSKKIRYNLLQKQVNPELIDSILKQSASDEYGIAKEIWRKKFAGVIPQDAKEKLRQIRFLQNRGFSYDIIIRIIK